MKVARKPVKNGKRVIGYVTTRPTGPFGHYQGYEVLPDGTERLSCGTHSQGDAIKILRENDDCRTLPKRPWKVRTANGSTLYVMASTENEAHDVAKIRLRRWAEKALDTVNAHANVTDEELAEAKERAVIAGQVVWFGLLESSK